MSAQNNLPEQQSSIHSNDFFNWLELFYGILTSPRATLAQLSNRDLSPPGLAALFGAMLVVILSSLACSSNAIDSVSLTGVTGDIVALILGNLFCWAMLAIFVRLLATTKKIPLSLRTGFLVTGWAFVPLTLKAPIACINNVLPLTGAFSLLVSIWFLILELLAFNCLLALGKFKTLVFILFLPPCLFFSYLISMLFANKIIFDAFS